MRDRHSEHEYAEDIGINWSRIDQRGLVRLRLILCLYKQEGAESSVSFFLPFLFSSRSTRVQISFFPLNGS